MPRDLAGDPHPVSLASHRALDVVSTSVRGGHARALERGAILGGAGALAPSRYARLDASDDDFFHVLMAVARSEIRAERLAIGFRRRIVEEREARGVFRWMFPPF